MMPIALPEELGETDVSESKVRVTLNRLAQKAFGLFVFLADAFIQIETALQIQTICLRVVRILFIQGALGLT